MSGTKEIVQQVLSDKVPPFYTNIVIFNCFILSYFSLLFLYLLTIKGKLEAMEDYNKLKVHVDEKEKELEATREVATREIDELKTKLSFANKLVFSCICFPLLKNY